MLTWIRWGSLVLAVSALVGWAVVSGLRLAYQGPSVAEMMAHGEPRRISDPMVYVIVPPVDVVALRRADVTLRISSALLVSLHLVILNLARARP